MFVPHSLGYILIRNSIFYVLLFPVQVDFVVIQKEQSKNEQTKKKMKSSLVKNYSVENRNEMGPCMTDCDRIKIHLEANRTTIISKNYTRFFSLLFSLIGITGFYLYTIHTHTR